ncbi:MAG: 3-methylcrotonyl-CoA carboxylase, partial [Alphaproteobacteria bacterium]|nr:3-methylcrotonyl-CoA carboxylase [Alphaproteobacteria bacterium]
TGFIARHRDSLVPELEAIPMEVLAFAAAATITERDAAAQAAAVEGDDRWSPWHDTGGWRLGAADADRLLFAAGGAQHSIAVTRGADTHSLALEIAGCSVDMRIVAVEGPAIEAVIDGRRLRAAAALIDDDIHVDHAGGLHRLTRVDPLSLATGDADAGGHLTAPMPGKVIAVHVAAGTAVKRGQPLVVLEAMKMEHTIAAPKDGIVERVAFTVGEQVEEGATLVDLGATPP